LPLKALEAPGNRSRTQDELAPPLAFKLCERIVNQLYDVGARPLERAGPKIEKIGSSSRAGRNKGAFAQICPVEGRGLIERLKNVQTSEDNGAFFTQAAVANSRSVTNLEMLRDGGMLDYFCNFAETTNHSVMLEADTAIAEQGIEFRV